MHGPSEQDPSVSLDIGLKQSLGLRDGEVIEVDYRNLRSSLSETGAPTDSSDLHIVFEPWNSTGPAGEYDPSETSARVEVDPEYLDDTQHTLIHELKHYSDDKKGHRSMRRSPMYDMVYDLSPSNHQGAWTAAFGLIAVPLALQVGTIFGAAPDMSSRSYDRMMGVLDIALATNTTFAVGLVALTAVYTLDPSERRARKAVDESTVPNVLSVTSTE